ncbi:MAG: hypothetical protein ACOYZ7_18325 [Chloroflexota bacterium]
MSSLVIFWPAYGMVWVGTVLWVGHGLWPRRRLALAPFARWSGGVAMVLLLVALGWHGYQAGRWPLFSPFEQLNLSLCALLLMSWGMVSPRLDGRLALALSVLASALAAGALRMAGAAAPTIRAPAAGWWAASVILNDLGAAAMVVAGLAWLLAQRPADGWAKRALSARQALSWGVLAAAVGLACGVWWFQRLQGRYWGDNRWAVVLIAGLVSGAVWQASGMWQARGWRSAAIGLLLTVAGGCVLWGVGGGVW